MATTTAKRRRSRHLIRAVLATVAVLGFGAAVTTAAWTDGVFFRAGVSSGTINLQGAVQYTDPQNPGTVPDGLDWQEFPGPDAAGMGEISRFTAPAIDFFNLGPGETRSATFWVRSTGSLAVRLVFDENDPASVSWTGTFADPPDVAFAAVDLNGNPVDLDGWILRGGNWLTITLTVTTPEDWPQANAGKSGQLVLVFEGTTDGAD